MKIEDRTSRHPATLIRKKDLAALLTVSPRTIDRYRKAGILPPVVRVSPHVVAWRITDIEKWLAERQEKDGQR